MPTYQIKHSTELMENYQQATVMAPQKEFRALQGADGGALLFSISSDELGAAFTVTAEVIGDRHGWEVVDLSSAAHQPAEPCQHFAVGQRPAGPVHLAMALRSGPAGQPTDTIYLADLTLADGHVQKPAWTAFPFDAAGTPRSRVEVAGIFLSQATDGEYAVVDLVRDPDSPTKQVVRYWIDRTKHDGRAWHLHDIPIDLAADVYSSVLGRRDGEEIDGVYVGGQIDGSPQILYTPLFNKLQPGRHPYSAYLSLSGDGTRVPDALAVCPNPDGTTDLYAAAAGGLYRFASTNQDDGATAVLALEHPLFARTQDLFAFDDGDRVVVWGRNADNLAFYTWCPRADLDAGKWSMPLPILTQVQHVSPFVNRGNRASTIVAHTGDNRLRIGLKSPGTGMWAWRDVTLPPAEVTVPARKINSYTTRIQVFDEHNQPAAGVTVALSASNVTTVYINHLYYVVGPTPIHVPADAAGSVTVIEAVPRITGARFQISVADDTGAGAAVNPMDKPLKRSTSLQSVGQLREAQVVTYANGQKQPPRNLIRNGLDDRTLQQVADLNKQCAAAYAHPKQAPSPAHQTMMAASPMHTFAVPTDTPRVDAGDLFQLMEAKSAEIRLRATRTAADAPPAGGTPHAAQVAAQETAWDVIVRWFEGAWEFVVKIGEAIYRCVLEVIEDIISAVRWVYDKIVAAIQDLIRFLQFLFEWDDFRRTKDVIKNVTTVFFQHEIDQIPVLQQKFNTAIDSLIAAIDAWGGVPKLDGLGAAGSARPSNQGSTDGPDAPGAMLSHHYQGNVGSASHTTEPPKPPANLFEMIENKLEEEKKTLGDAFDQLKQLVKDAATLPLDKILKRLAAILADAVLRSARVVIDAILDVVHLIAQTLLDFLDVPIHIPVISDILNAIGVPDFSMLDIICWVAAVPVTIGYKVATAIAGDGRAPFPDNAETRLLIETKDFATIQAAFTGKPVSRRAVVPGPGRAALAPADTLTAEGPITLSPAGQEAVFITLHSVAGVCAMVSAFLDAFESILPSKTVPKLLSIGSGVSAFIGGVARGVGNALVPRYPVLEEEAILCGRLTLIVFVLNKVGAAAAAKFQASSDLSDYRAIGAWIDAFLILPAAGVTILHFVELSREPAGRVRSVAIVDESSGVVSYVARFLYTLVVGGPIQDPETKAALAAVMGVTEVVYGGMQFAVAAVEGLG